MASFLFFAFVRGSLLLNQSSNKLCAPSLHPTRDLRVPKLLCPWQRLPSTQQATPQGRWGHVRGHRDEVALSTARCWGEVVHLPPPTWDLLPLPTGPEHCSAFPGPEFPAGAGPATHPGAGEPTGGATPPRRGSRPGRVTMGSLCSPPSSSPSPAMAAAGSAGKDHFLLVKEVRTRFAAIALSRKQRC